MKKALECFVVCSFVAWSSGARAITSAFDCRGLLRDQPALSEVLSVPPEDVELLIAYLAAITHEVEAIEAAPSRLNVALAEPHARAKFALVNYVRTQFADASRRFVQNQGLAADPGLDQELRTMVEDERQSLTQELRSHHDEIYGLIEQAIYPGVEDAVIVEIRPATGLGFEERDTDQLARMYLNFARKQGWTAEVLDESAGSSPLTTLRLAGPMAQRWMNAESGVHRLIGTVSSPVAHSKHKIHTRYQQIVVYAEPKRQEFQLNLGEVAIESFRSAGPGGQHANTTDSAVRVRHLPTGLEVVMSSRRSQHRNKDLAIDVLRAKLFERHLAAEREALNQARKSRDAQEHAKERYVRTYDERTNRVESDALMQGGLRPIFEVRQRRELRREMKRRLHRD